MRIGCFDNFGDWETVILIDGNSVELASLADILCDLEGSDNQSVTIHELPFATSHGHVELTAYPAGDREGLIRAGNSSCQRFDWFRRKEGWIEAAEKIQAVADSTRAGHVYLDSLGRDDAIVIVSKAEYDEVWWMRG